MVVDTDQVRKLAQHYGYQEYMVKRYLELFGEETKAFLEGNEQNLPTTIRINELAVSVQEAVDQLSSKGVHLAQINKLPYAFQVVQSKLPIGATTEYLMGWYMLQSPASMWAVETLNPRKTKHVADLCAAPGGKTTHIAQLMQNQGVLVAIDINRQRIRALRSNVSRLRVKNTLIMRMDAANLPKYGMLFDSVLLDAPCTGEGLIPVDPTRKQSRALKDIQTLAQVQKKLVRAGVELVRKGGILVYSTCSFAPEENEQIINFALQKLPVRVIDTGLPIGDPGFISPFGQEVDPSLELARRFVPYKHQMEGFFICKLEKS